MDLIFEINALETINHPNIVRIFAYAHSDRGNKGEFLIIMQHGGKTLTEAVQQGEIKTAPICLNMFIQICSGLEYMHSLSERYVHRDLKPDNIFVLRNEDITNARHVNFYTVKIGDLGETSYFTGSDGEMERHAQGTPTNMAYEIFIKYAHGERVKHLDYTQSVDIYALALIFMYMVSDGILPFNMDVAQTSEKIPCLPDYFPAKVTNILVKMLHKNSESRPNIKDCRYYFEHFLKDSDTKKKMKKSWKAYRKSLKEQRIINYDYKSLKDVILNISDSNSSSDD